MVRSVESVESVVSAELAELAESAILAESAESTESAEAELAETAETAKMAELAELANRQNRLNLQIQQKSTELLFHSYRQQSSPSFDSIDIWPASNSRLTPREMTSNYVARWASVLAWSAQLIIFIFAQHQRFANMSK